MTGTGQPLWFKLVAAFALAVGLTMSAAPTLVYIAMSKSVGFDRLISFVVERSLPIVLVMIAAFAGAVWLDPRRRPNTATNVLGIALVIAAVAMVYGLR